MPADPTRPPGASPAWPRAAQWAFAFLLGVIATLLLVRFTPIFQRPRPTELASAAVDLNRASRAELMQLPQVSERRAGEILATRDRRGGFRSPDDLRSVKGIGPARREQLSPWVKATADEQWLRTSQKPAEGPAPTRSKKEAPAEPINVNDAAAEELQRLPGVGPVMASRIVAERQKKPFQAPEDLRRVSGIGPKTLEKLRPLVKFE
jgi:competence protein ComEA